MSESALYRVVLRGIVLPCIKYIWMHCILEFALVYQVKDSSNVFIMLLIPLGIVTAAG